MTEGRRHFFLKLIPCRPTFALDMTDEERAIMQRHVVYWRGLMDEGRVVVFGPVMDPGGPYGMGVIEAADEDEVENLLNGIRRRRLTSMSGIRCERCCRRVW